MPGVLEKLLYEQIGGAYEGAPPAQDHKMTDIEITTGNREPTLRGRRLAYDYQWRAFTDWCLERHGDVPLPVPASTVGEYLSYRAAAGARFSTLRVITAAIAHQHTGLELPNPCKDPIVESVLAESERRAPPAAPRSLPLDLEAYRAIRETAQLPRPGRGGWSEALMSASHRGRMDIAMIGLMRDGLLRVKEASDLTWSAIDLMDDGTGRLHLGEGDAAVARTLSADTMMMLDSVRGNARDDERILGLMPNRVSARIGAAAEQAGLGPGYSGESPRLGMLKDLDELGAVLLGERIEDRGFPDGAGA